MQTFLNSPVLYSTTPPKPTAYPKMYKIALDPTRHFAHKITSAFLADSKPLLTRCDVGLPFDDLIINHTEYENQEGELHPDDLNLIREIVDKK